ncbi:hypothetical protein ACHAQH_008848 [Verticillium albo-atrum]
MADSISEGTLASLLKQVGEQVKADEELARIETDKIDVAVNAPEAGVLREVFVAEGDVVTVDMAREVVVFRDYVDISIAVSAPKGLITPVLRNTESLSIVELERDVAELTKRGRREGKLTMGDLEGGNFSISNPGIFGSMFGRPLVNYPQAAVFNMNSIKDRVVAN